MTWPSQEDFATIQDTFCFSWGPVIGPISKTLESISNTHQGESSEAGLGGDTFWGQCGTRLVSESQAESTQQDGKEEAWSWMMV